MKTILTIGFFFVSLFCFTASGTGQMKDNLWLGNHPFYINEQPLSQVYNDDEIQKIVRGYQGDVFAFCSANYREYVANWAIYDGQLELLWVYTAPCSNKIEVPASLFFGADSEYPVKANWYNGQVMFRISEISYDDNSNTESYEAVVYAFEAGIQQSRVIKTIRLHH